MPRLLRLGAHAARIALGLIFLAAGVLKMADVAEFAHQIAGYGIFGKGFAAIAAPAMIALETTLAVALLVGWRTRMAAILIGALLVFFVGLEGWNLAQGKTEACGCFGAYVKRTPAQVIGEDLLFLGLAVVTVVGLGAWQTRRRSLAAVAVGITAVLACGLAIASPRLPIDPWVTELAVGRSVEDLGLAAKIDPDTAANGLVAILDLTDPVSKEASAELNALMAAPGAPRILALTPSTEEEHAVFLWDSYPSFELKTADRPLLKRLYRRLPLYFRLESGRVTAVYGGPRPPAGDLLSSGPS
ncbi:MAG TPA: MauE/DoxX family redox-associated membrane protein [Candidatus Polarisedimenticolia bacterium]|nr:MauE/DoxX family redox-associated membrane protein [Candidatus Polarisedimenticolia bacterium]